MNVVLLHEPARVDELRAFLTARGFSLAQRPHALLFAQREGVNVAAYGTGKLLLGGPQAEEFAGVLVGQDLARREVRVTGPFTPHAGSDESGKGDYFGPLAVASVYVPTREVAEALVRAGVRDSKALAPGLVGPLASLVKARCPHAVVTIAPPTYNETYARFGNLNHMLAWAHARAIEDLLAQTGVVPVLVDQFARGVLQRHLMPLGKQADVREKVRAESDVPVAAASVVARAEFLAGLARASRKIGFPLPRGAGPAVTQAAREVVGEKGFEALGKVAKMHFAITHGVRGA